MTWLSRAGWCAVLQGRPARPALHGPHMPWLQEGQRRIAEVGAIIFK